MGTPEIAHWYGAALQLPHLRRHWSPRVRTAGTHKGVQVWQPFPSTVGALVQFEEHYNLF